MEQRTKDIGLTLKGGLSYGHKQQVLSLLTSNGEMRSGLCLPYAVRRHTLVHASIPLPHACQNQRVSPLQQDVGMGVWQNGGAVLVPADLSHGGALHAARHRRPAARRRHLQEGEWGEGG